MAITRALSAGMTSGSSGKTIEPKRRTCQRTILGPIAAQGGRDGRQVGWHWELTGARHKMDPKETKRREA